MTSIIYDISALAAAYGGAEVFFNYQNASGLTVKLITNIGALDQYLDANADTFYTADVSFTTFEHDGNTYARIQTFLNNAIVDQSDFDLGCATVQNIKNRVVFDKSAVSVYCDDIWVYTYSFVTTIWPEETTISLQVSGADVFINIINVELADPREAVYIDYEATTDSAIQSIIQQRPIQIFPEIARANTFTYSTVRDSIDAHHVVSFEEITQDNSQLSSDGLVYYRDVGVANSDLTAAQVGLITRLYRLSELDNGAVRATKRIQQIAIEQRQIVRVQSRFDMRLQIADLLLFDIIVTSTQRHIVDEIIVQDIQLDLRDGGYSMNVSGRRRLS